MAPELDPNLSGKNEYFFLSGVFHDCWLFRKVWVYLKKQEKEEEDEDEGTESILPMDCYLQSTLRGKPFF